MAWLGDPGDEKLDLRGKIALLRLDESAETSLNQALSHGAAGLILLGTKREDTDLFGKQPLASSIMAEIPVLELTLDGSRRLQELLDLDYTGIQELSPGTTLGVHVSLVSSASAKRSVRTSNILGLVPGSDPLLSRQVIVVGAHYDHVGDDPPASCAAAADHCPQSSRYSGLNDNASGVAVLLEITRLWHEIGYRPKHSVLFAAWGAQELGQLGSGHFVKAPTWPLTSTIATLQLDGIGGGEGFYPGLHGRPGEDQWLINYLTSAAEQLDQKVVHAPTAKESDHLPFEQAGVPSLLVSWRLANENNLPDSLANGISLERMGATGQVVALALMMIAR